MIMQNLEEKVKELGGTSIELSAQLDKQGFYKRNGYKPRGQVYNDEHCPHIDMVKEIR